MGDVVALSGGVPPADRLVGYLRRRSSAITKEMVTQMLTQVPGYRQLDGAARHDVTRGTRFCYGVVLRTLAGDGSLTAEAVAGARKIGADQADNAVPWSSSVAAIQVSTEVVWQNVRAYLDLLPDGDHHDALMAHATRAMTLVSTGLVAAVGEGHWRRTAELKDRAAHMAHVLRDLFHGTASPEQTTERAQELGLDLVEPHGLLVLTGPLQGLDEELGLADWPARRATIVARLDEHGSPAHRVLVVQTDEFAWKKLVEPAAHRMSHRARASMIGVCPVRTAAMLQQAYLDCRDALSAAMAASRGPAYADIEELALLRVFHDRGSQLSLVRKTLGPILDLAEPRRSHLLETLAAYMEEGGAGEDRQQRICTRLHVSWGTVRQRLSQARRLTGVPDGTTAGDARLLVVLQLLRLHHVALASTRQS